MKRLPFMLITASCFLLTFSLDAQFIGRFNTQNDLLLVQFDCKTDVDDVESAAALATLLSNTGFSAVRYHAVAGTYGIQEGLYVPANELFQLAFGTNWTDANENRQAAVRKVVAIIKNTFSGGGDVWIGEAGQSDFTALLIKSVQSEMPLIITKQRFHVVQHADWNEQSTSPESLQYVKENSDYHKIPDGNTVGNGSPGFRTPEYTAWKSKIADQKLIAVWQLAVDICNRYNGMEGRYKNESISSGGLDFSDLSEVCWIFGLEKIKDTEEFFRLYSK
ncbi:MAG TPA: hypothetical protein VK179_05285 [Bacteroidales bacterium]|nr:hypothetical protein [Bacteroidales bacterium]